LGVLGGGEGVGEAVEPRLQLLPLRVGEPPVQEPPLQQLRAAGRQHSQHDLSLAPTPLTLGAINKFPNKKKHQKISIKTHK